MRSFDISKAVGLPVICFHGSPGSPKDFNALIKKLPQYAFNPLIRKNYPYYDPKRYSNAGDTNSILLGHSWGCRETLEFFLQYSDKIKGLVLISPHILHSEKPSFFKKILISSTCLSSLFLRLQSSLATESSTLNQSDVHTNELKKFTFISNILIIIRSIYEKMERQLISYASILRMVGTFDIPLHIVYGNDDRCPHVNSSISMIKKIIPDAILHPVENCGQELLHIHPARIAYIIKSLQTSQEQKTIPFQTFFSRKENSLCLFGN